MKNYKRKKKLRTLRISKTYLIQKKKENSYIYLYEGSFQSDVRLLLIGLGAENSTIRKTQPIPCFYSKTYIEENMRIATKKDRASMKIWLGNYGPNGKIDEKL